MPDKTYAKFILNNETYLDLTGDTVDSSSLLSGYTAHDRSGTPITGSFDSSIFVLKAGDTMSGSLTIANIEAEQLFEINSKSGLRLALDMSSLCNHGIWSSGYANSLTADGAYIADSSWIIVRDSSNRVKIPKWASIGSSASPVYFDANGQPQQSTYSFSSYLLKTGGTLSGVLNINVTSAPQGLSYGSNISLGNSTRSTTSSGSSYGNVRFYSELNGYIDLRSVQGAESNYTIYLPAKSGTVALTSDLGSYLPLTGGTLTGILTLSGAPTENLHAATKKYVDDSVANYLPLTGGTLTGNLTINHPGGDGSASIGAELTLGNNIEWDQENSSFGYINLYSTGTYKCSLCTANNITSNKVLYLPNKDGTLAVTSDLDSYVLKAGDTMTGPLILSASSPVTTGVEYISTLDKNILTLSAKSLASGLTMSEIVTTVEPGSIKVYDDIVQSNYNYTEITSNEVCIYVSDDGEDEVISKIGANELTINRHDLLRMTPHFAQMFATEIPANANLNTTTYLKVGQYYCSTTYGFTNSPTGNQFVMEVSSMIYSRYDDESETTAAYRVRKITDYIGNQFIQYCSKPTNGSWSYGVWKLYITGSKVGTLANASGTSLVESYCQQYGRTVNVRAWITGLSTTTQTHENVITVQSVDLPTTAVRFVFTCWLDNGIAAYAGYGSMATNGKITLVKAVANSNKASFEFTYNV